MLAITFQKEQTQPFLHLVEYPICELDFLVVMACCRDFVIANCKSQKMVSRLCVNDKGGGQIPRGW